MPLPYLTKIVSLCAVMCFIVGCDTTTVNFKATPAITVNPNSAVPLAAIVSATTSKPTVLLIQVSDGSQDWTIPISSALATSHSLPILGFKPDRRHVVEVTARDEAGNLSATIPLEFITAALPDDFPKLTVSVSKPEKMEPGITLFALMRWPDGADANEEFGLAIAVNEQGEVVWYRRQDPMFEHIHRMANGNLFSMVGHNRLEEIDMLGNTVTRWHASKHPNPKAVALVSKGSIPVAVETFHHDIQQLPSGNLLVLSTELRRIEEYPTVVDDENAAKEPANVVGDVVVEFARDGSIVNEWKLMDLLDVRRLGHESLGPIWGLWAYTEVEGGTKDWSHANSISYVPETDSILVSVRHQEAVISFSRKSGELNWILGTHEGWGERWGRYLLEPRGEFEWQFHQHAARMTARGSLLLFDNGNFRSLPPKPRSTVEESYSRAVEYMIDTESKTVRQIWSYGGAKDELFYSPFISEVDQLPHTGNLLITDGGRIRDGMGRQSERIVGDHHWARIMEVMYSDHPEKVFEITIDSQEYDKLTGWAIYRSDRLPSLYSGRSHTR